ncbi:glycosyltransferase [Patulibacter sp. NPDC049589]|uniref:glycosyltransferase n=1 Tax=Patulibacter sp. NPDC049589 TaxID=3154731 RepID=UPI00342E3B90
MKLLTRTPSISFERLNLPGPGTKRVLFVTNMWPDEVRPYYGSFIRSQARSLMDRGLGVDLIYVRGFESKAAYVSAIPRIARRIDSGDYDVVHVHYGHTAVSSLLSRATPTVVSFCGEDLLGAPRANGITFKSRLEVAIFRQVARFADATITKSKEMAQVLPGSVQARNHVLANGVDLDRFQRRDRAAARAELGWEPTGEVMLFLGNPDDPRKNVELARAAAERVTRERPGARLFEAWGVPADQVPVVMNASNCLVFPSKSEGSPNAVKEAMASEMPIVATPVGDIEERFQGVDDCFVRAPDTGAFADAIARALDAGISCAARAAVEPLSVAAVAARLEAIYTDTIHHAHRRQRVQ